MFRNQLFIEDKFGSLVAVKANTEGELVTSASDSTPVVGDPSGTAVFIQPGGGARFDTNPYDLRDITATAAVTLTNGTETTLLGSTSVTRHNLVHVTASNNSTVAAAVDLRSNTGDSVVITLEVPANDTVTVPYHVPYPQEAQEDVWSADMGDITATTISINALFIKET